VAPSAAWPGEGIWRALEDTTGETPPELSTQDGTAPDATAQEPAAQDTAVAPGHDTAATVRPGGTGQGVDLDAVVQAVEERIVRQIERRGGRYAGLF
jgi:hypothetical protein